MKVFLHITILFAALQVFAQKQETSTDSVGKAQGKWIIYGKEPPSNELQKLKPPFTGYKISYFYFADSTGKIDSLQYEKGNYVNDRKEGLWIKYFDDGITPKLIAQYENNSPCGDYMKFYPNGQLREKGCLIKNDLRDSIIKYYSSGQVDYVVWHNEKGKEEGDVKFYYENGQLEFVFNAKNGTPVDTAYRYYNNGDLKELIVYDLDGSITKTIPHDAVNPLLKETPKQQILPPKIPNNPGFMDENNKPNGYHKIYNENGEIWLDGLFSEGVLQSGKVYEYDNDGVLLKVSFFVSGKHQ